MLGFPHLTHAAMPEQPNELVTPQLACLGQLVPHFAQEPRRHHRQHRTRIVGPEDHEGLQRREHRDAAQMCQPDAQRIQRCRDHRGANHLERADRRHHGIHEQENRDPRHLDHLSPQRRRLDPRIHGRDRSGGQDHIDEAHVDLRLRRVRRVAHVQKHQSRNCDAQHFEDVVLPDHRPVAGGNRYRDDRIHHEPGRPQRTGDQAEQRQALELVGDQIVRQPFADPRRVRLPGRTRWLARADELFFLGHAFIPSAA